MVTLRAYLIAICGSTLLAHTICGLVQLSTTVLTTATVSTDDGRVMTSLVTFTRV